jgi:hypothetical protein
VGDPRDDLPIRVLADQDGDVLIAVVVQQGQELPVPQGEDDGLARGPRRAQRLIVRHTHAPGHPEQPNNPDPDASNQRLATP